MENCINDFMTWMSSNRLKLNGDKTELTVFASPRVDCRIRPVLPSLNLDSVHIPSQSSCRVLGSHFDSKLSMDQHISQFIKSANFQISNMYSIRKFLDPKTTESLVHAFITSRMDYCNSLLFGISKNNLFRLQKVQNRAARLCLGLPKYSRIHISTILKIPFWLPIVTRIDF